MRLLNRSFSRVVAACLAVLLSLSLLLSGMPQAAAQSLPPSLSVNRDVVTPGMQLSLTLSGFTQRIDLAALWDGAFVTLLAPSATSGSFTRDFTVPVDAVAGTRMLTVCAALSDGSCFTGEFSQQASVQLLVEPGLAAVPPELLRRAAAFVAELRGSELAPGWAEAYLGPFARPLYRPDLGDEPAYYEFEVLAPLPQIDAAPAQQFGGPAGFVVLSTGEHDLPIPHWSDRGASLTEQLRAQARTNDQDTPVRFYKLDALAYVAEDAEGQQVAELGSPLLRVVGLTPELIERYGGERSEEWTPDPNDPAGEGTLRESGPELPGEDEFKLEGWASLAELKSGYAEAYEPFTEDLRALAAPFWEAERADTQFGIGLLKGDIYNLALVGGGVAPAVAPGVSLTGPGAALVSGALVEDEGPIPFYRITVLDDVPGAEVAFTATVSYDGGASESFNFFIINALPNRIHLPLVVGGAGTSSALAPTAQPTAELAQAWGPWRFWWAGSHADQRIYRQLRRNEAGNGGSCVSGCGATAWAMLFGWVDVQAHNNRIPWRNSTGIYRTNGSLSGSPTAIAPSTMNFPLTSEQQGAAAMTLELKNRIGTFCALGSGATFPWRMGDARRYLQGRSANPISTHYSSVGIRRDSYRNRARDAIVFRGTPAIIGTGWLSHYPLAYGYAERTRRVRSCNFLGFNCRWKTEVNRSFFVNQGWAGSDDNLVWVSSGTWFAGQVFPTP